MKSIFGFFDLKYNAAVGLHLMAAQVGGKCTKQFRRLCVVFYANRDKTKPVKETARRCRGGCDLCDGVVELVARLNCCKARVCKKCITVACTVHPCAAAYIKCGVCLGDSSLYETIAQTKCCRIRMCMSCTNLWYIDGRCNICHADETKYINKLKFKAPLICYLEKETGFLDVECLKSASLETVIGDQLLLDLPAIPQKMCEMMIYNFNTLSRLLTTVPGKCGAPACPSRFIRGAPFGFLLPPLPPPEWTLAELHEEDVWSDCVLCVLIKQNALAKTLCIDETAFIEESSYLFCAVQFDTDVNLEPINYVGTAVHVKEYLGVLRPLIHYHYQEFLSKLRFTDDGVLDLSLLAR